MKNWKRYSLILVLLFAAVLSSCRSSVQTMGEPAEGAGREGNGGKASRTSDNIVICLDAGHGFDDIGTSSEFLADTTEKEITLAIVLKLRDCLVDNGFDVILTHNGELFPKTRIDDGNNVFNPQERIAYADTLDIDCFVSIHCDSFVSDSSVHGTRVYYSKGTTHQKESASAAKEISAAIDAAFPDAKKCLTKDMEKDSAYYVIREAKVPSVLIEVGFVTNPDDANNMKDEQWRSSFASATASAITAFFTE